MTEKIEQRESPQCVSALDTDYRNQPGYLLRQAGHIASLVNPPGNPRASYYIGGEPGPDPEAWRENAERRSGSWWETWVEWTRDHSGDEKAAPRSMGNKKYPPLDLAPGKYINT